MDKVSNIIVIRPLAFNRNSEKLKEPI